MYERCNINTTTTTHNNNNKSYNIIYLDKKKKMNWMLPVYVFVKYLFQTTPIETFLMNEHFLKPFANQLNQYVHLFVN